MGIEQDGDGDCDGRNRLGRRKVLLTVELMPDFIAGSEEEDLSCKKETLSLSLYLVCGGLFGQIGRSEEGGRKGIILATWNGMDRVNALWERSDQILPSINQSVVAELC